MSIIKVENICKIYRNTNENIHALKDINFELEEGEMLAIMGSSGSGKSTLLHIIGALDTPDKGRIYLNSTYEKNYNNEPYATEIRSKYIGFVFQKFNLLSDLTVEENVALPLVLSGIKGKEIAQIVHEKLKIVGLEGKEYRYPLELSGGQQQRVAIARAIATNPMILLADEPTGNLDYNTSIGIMNLLSDMNKKINQSTIVVTHDPLIASYANRIIFFHDGFIKAEYRTNKGPKDIENILNIFQSLV